MEHNVVITRKAEQDVDEAYVWYEKKQEGLGLKFYLEFRSYVDLLGASAESFPVKIDGKIRELVLNVFPYVIIYEVIEDEVRVYRVFATAQNPDKKLQEPISE